MSHALFEPWAERTVVSLAAVGCGLAAAVALRASGAAHLASGSLLLGLAALTGVAKSGST